MYHVINLSIKFNKEELVTNCDWLAILNYSSKNPLSF